MTDEELAWVREELAELYHPEGVELWLISPHKLLGGRRAVDCDALEVLQIINQLQSGAVL
jgi:hypothetical protein